MHLQEAAQRLGVHYQTAYKWVRNGTLPAVKRGASYDVAEPEVDNLRARRLAPVPAQRVTAVRDWELQRSRLHRTLIDGDELAARGVVDRLRDGAIEPLALIEHLVAPVMRQIGEQWAAGGVSVAVEHRASAICERLLARAAVHPRGRPRGVAIVATLPGEEHGLPAVMATVALRADRWQVHHLGTQVPVADLVELSGAVAAELVVLSMTTAAASESARSALAATSARLLVGGPGRSVRELVQAARQIGPGDRREDALG